MNYNNTTFITIKQAMEISSLSRKTIYTLRKNMLIKSFNVDTGNSNDTASRKNQKVLIVRQSLLDYLESNPNFFIPNNNSITPKN